jgi:hypothetical protein
MSPNCAIRVKQKGVGSAAWLLSVSLFMMKLHCDVLGVCSQKHMTHYSQNGRRKGLLSRKNVQYWTDREVANSIEWGPIIKGNGVKESLHGCTTIVPRCQIRPEARNRLTHCQPLRTILWAGLMSYFINSANEPWPHPQLCGEQKASSDWPRRRCHINSRAT